ncbi:MAG: Maf family protein [Pseudomonadota bacterium]
MTNAPLILSPVVLASGSSSRLAILRGAGLDVHVDKPGVDETLVKQSLRADGAQAHDVAEALAEMKAVRISTRQPDAHVIGADQMLVCGDVWFDKPPDRDHLRAQLQALRGKSHQLISSVVIAMNGARIWHHTDRATLTMRDFSESFLEAYMDTVGDKALESVGGYQIEGPGAQLFSQVIGDQFTIMGLPLLPVLDFLRTREVLSA